jgi:hypothetical protein
MEAGMSIDDVIADMRKKADPRFDPFLDFCKEHGLLSKLSCHDMRQISNYFKENWRPE